MTIGCSIWMICLKLNWFLYGLSRMLQFSEFVWALSYSVWDVFNNFLLIETTDRSKISSDQMRFFIAFSLYPISFFANIPFKLENFKRFWPSVKSKSKNTYLTPLYALNEKYQVRLHLRKITITKSLESKQLPVPPPFQIIKNWHLQGNS